MTLATTKKPNKNEHFFLSIFTMWPKRKNKQTRKKSLFWYVLWFIHTIPLNYYHYYFVMHPCAECFKLNLDMTFFLVKQAKSDSFACLIFKLLVNLLKVSRFGLRHPAHTMRLYKTKVTTIYIMKKEWYNLIVILPIWVWSKSFGKLVITRALRT